MSTSSLVLASGEYSCLPPFSGVCGLAIVDKFAGKKVAGDGVRNASCRPKTEIFVTKTAGAASFDGLLKCSELKMAKINCSKLKMAMFSWRRIPGLQFCFSEV